MNSTSIRMMHCYNVILKAMLHEAIFPATCNATFVASQVAGKKFTCNTPFCNCNCGIASCKKSRTISYFSQCCEISNIPSATCNAILSEWANQSSSFARCRRLSTSAILFVIVRIASCEQNCTCVTPPLQLERFFIRHRCVASCKKNCLV